MLPKFFINRPIVAMVISILTIILGVISLLRLPISQYPDIVPPAIQVVTNFTGADGNDVANSVASPIEKEMAGVDNMEYMYSTSTNTGSYTLNVIFKTGTDANIDQVLAQMRNGQANAKLPPEVINSGVTVKKSPSAPLMLVALYSTSELCDNVYLANYANLNLVDEIKRIYGVGDVNVFGSGQYAMRIWLKPDKLASLNITVDEIANAIKGSNRINPSGAVGGRPSPIGQDFTFTVRTKGRLESKEEFENIIVRSDNNGVVRIKNIARCELDAQNYVTEAFNNGRPSAVMGIYQAPGTNAIATVDGVTKRMEELAKAMPDDVKYNIPLDTTLSVRQGIKEIQATLLEALGLVILVVFVFLQGWRATLIPAIAVPVSIIGTFAVFPLLGFSINTIALLGMVLAIGLVVDDAIVVVENVEHHMEHGLSPKEASIKAMEEITGPVIAISIVLSAVFLPPLFLDGITGTLFQQFAVTIAISVLISAFNALSLSPALSAMLLKPKDANNRGPLSAFYNWFNKVFGRVTDGFVGICGYLIRKMIVSFVILGIAVAGIWVIGGKVPGGFLPEEDQGYVYAGLMLPPTASLDRTVEATKFAEKLIMEIPGVEYVTTINGFNMVTGVNTSNSAFFYISLKPWDERKDPSMHANGIVAAISTKLHEKVPHGAGYCFPPPAISGIGNAGGVTMVLEDRVGAGQEKLAEASQTFIAALRQRPEILNVNPGLDISVPQIRLKYDDDKLIRQGCIPDKVKQTLQCYLGGTFVNYFNAFNQQWQVFMQADSKLRSQPEDILNYYVPNREGKMVPVSTFASIEPSSGSDFIMRFNQYTGNQLSIMPKPGYSSAQVMKAIESVYDELKLDGIGMDYKDMSYQEKKAQQGVPIWLTFALSALFVFLILAAQYESWALPVSVLATVPVAVTGAYAALYFAKLDFNLYAEIGLVMLIGLAAKNAILIVEFAKEKSEAGVATFEASVEAARLRLRPILMTSFAFILGCVPLVLSSGAGSLARQIIGWTVIGGMLTATLIGTLLIPASYYLVERLRGGKKSN